MTPAETLVSVFMPALFVALAIVAGWNTIRRNVA